MFSNIFKYSDDKKYLNSYYFENKYLIRNIIDRKIVCFFKVFFVYIHYFCLSLKYGGKMMNIKRYNEIADKNRPQKQVLKHILSAFLVGGIIGMIGEFFLNLYQKLFSFSEKEATPIMLITLILIAAILTGLGLYDRLGNFAGAGSFIPITGFSNAMTSSALEARTEGLVTGIGANIFKLGGAVITFGIVASFIVGGLRYVISYFW